MGTAKPMPTKKRWSVGFRIAGDDADDLASAVTSGPPELPGLTAASNWMRLVSRRFPSGERNSRRKPDTTPAVAEGPMPNGKPTATTWSPKARSAVERMVAANKIVGNRLRLKHGQIMLRPHAGHRGVGFEPVGEHHLHPLGAEHNVKIGEDDAFVDDDDPGADALFGVLAALCPVPYRRTRTIDGRMTSYAFAAGDGRVLVSSVCSTAARISS